eukprot:350264-Chlamydomonas_euryale.AAC.13
MISARCNRTGARRTAPCVHKNSFVESGWQAAPLCARASRIQPAGALLFCSWEPEWAHVQSPPLDGRNAFAGTSSWVRSLYLSPVTLQLRIWRFGAVSDLTVRPRRSGLCKWTSACTFLTAGSPVRGQEGQRRRQRCESYAALRCQRTFVVSRDDL